MSIENQIHTIELQREQAQEMADLKRSVDRLMKNRDFKKVVLEDYFKDEAVRLVMLRADPNFASDEHQETLIKSIDAIGLFRQFLHAKTMLGQQALDAMDDIDQELDALRAEDGAE